MIAAAGFDRVLGSLHAVPFRGRLTAADDLYPQMPADEVMRRYFAEVVRLVEGSDVFQVWSRLTSVQDRDRMLCPIRRDGV